MFLTTEPSLQGRRYNPVKVVHAKVCESSEQLGTDNAFIKRWNKAIENALGKLQSTATIDLVGGNSS